MNTVVLVYPRTSWDIKNVTTRLPLALLYVGSALQKKGFSVRLIDQRTDDLWIQTLKEALNPRPAWVGISAMTGQQIRSGLEAARVTRETDPSIPIVWGGVHPTILPAQTLADPLVDIVVIGEGEETASDLSRVLSAGDPHPDLSGIPGLAWKRDGHVVTHPPRPHIPMDDLPVLDYGLIDIEPYVLSELPGERSLQMTTSRGCPRRCGYCYLSVVPDGRRYRAEAPERTVDQIARLAQTFRLNAIHIIDDEFFTDIGRARRVCELLIQRGSEVTLRTNCRVDHVIKMSPEDLLLFRRAGFKHLYLGAESGCDRVLSFIQKGITRQQILQANLRLRDADICPKFSFMAGFPTETMAEIKETLSLMLQLARENPAVHMTPVQLYSPYPGTDLFERCLRNGWHAPESLEGWGDSSWERIEYNWLSAGDQGILEKMAYFSFFLDGKTVAESMKSPLMRRLACLYGAIVWQRVRWNFYALMPEVALIRRALAQGKR